jgi:hypothetical protein
MIQTKDWIILVAIFGTMGVGILWPEAGAPLRPYPVVTFQA